MERLQDIMHNSMHIYSDNMNYGAREDNTKPDFEYGSTDSNNNKPDSSGETNISDKIIGKITSTTIGKLFSISDSARISNNIRTILQSLFALIGFVILVFAIFAASVRGELVQVATSVFIVAFIAAIVGAFTLFGVVVYQIRLDNAILSKSHSREIGDKDRKVAMVTNYGFDLYLQKMEKDKRYSFKYGPSLYQAAKNEQGDLELFEVE